MTTSNITRLLVLGSVLSKPSRRSEKRAEESDQDRFTASKPEPPGFFERHTLALATGGGLATAAGLQALQLMSGGGLTAAVALPSLAAGAFLGAYMGLIAQGGS